MQFLTKSDYDRLIKFEESRINRLYDKFLECQDSDSKEAAKSLIKKKLRNIDRLKRSQQRTKS